MAYRFTDTDKWRDAWFSNLSQIEMLLFMYLCDICDIAGIAEVNLRIWAFELRSNESTIKGALEGLQKSITISQCGNYIYLKNFLKHQKNLPLNQKNPAHRGIIKRFEMNLSKFIEANDVIDIDLINSFINSPNKGASKGLQSLIGNGNTKSNSKGKNAIQEKKETQINQKDEIKEKYNIDDAFAKVIIDWFDYKKANNQAYKSEQGKTAFVNKLKELSGNNSDEAREIINESMANNWKGIFKRKNEDKPKIEAQAIISQRKKERF